MKVKRCLLFNLIMICLLLCSCGKQGETVSETSVTISDSMEISTEETIPEEDETEDISSTDITDYFSMEEIMQLYTDYLINLYPAGSEDATTVRYYLAWINSDEIPELIYMEGNYHAAGVHVCICDRDGNVSDIGEFGEYGNFAYKPQKGNIMSFYMNSGIYFLDFYTLNGMSIIDDKYFEIDEGSGDNSASHYYVDGDEVDEYEYYRIYKAMNSSSYINLNYDDALSYINTDDILRVLTEFSTTKTAPSIINVSSSYPDLPGEWVCMSANIGDGNGYEEAAILGIDARIFISDVGNITFVMEYEETRIEDYQMTIKELYKDNSDPNYVAIGFNNQDASREFLVFTSENNTITGTITDFSGSFSVYGFNLVFTKTESDEL